MSLDLRSGEKKRKASNICEHGLTDNVEPIVKTTIQEYRAKKRTTILSYWCNEHNKYGTFTAVDKKV